MAASFSVVKRDNGTIGKSFAYDVTVTSASDGSGTSEYSLLGPFKGYLWQVVTNPDGSSAPSDNWAVYIEDEAGVDLLGNAGINRDTTNSEVVYPDTTDSSKPQVDGKLRVRVASMGDTKIAVVSVFILTK